MIDSGTIKACIFDAYGTLFDVHSAVARHRDRLGQHADAVSMSWRSKQLEYTWLRSLMGKHADFAQVTAEGLDYALAAHRINDETLRNDLLAAYQVLDAYPEVGTVLSALRQRGLRTGILSNGSPAMLEAAVTSSGISALLDEVLSIESAGVYKPHPDVYQLACERFKAKPSEICFQSSNGWDAAGARAFGFRVVWINRFAQPRETLPFPPDIETSDLTGLLTALSD